MRLRGIAKNWDRLGREDPLWSILTLPAKKGGGWDEEEFFATGRHAIALMFEFIRELGLRRPSRRALDFGCGAGRLTQALGPRFDEVYGVDIAASMIELAERFNRYGDRCRYLRNEANDLRLFPDAHFDLVYSNITLQHMPPRLMKGYLAEFLRVVSPDGLIVFQIPRRPRWGLVVRTRLAGMRAELRGKSRIPMYWMQPKRVISFCEHRGGRILDVRSAMRSENWDRIQYWIARAAEPSR